MMPYQLLSSSRQRDITEECLVQICSILCGNMERIAAVFDVAEVITWVAALKVTPSTEAVFTRCQIVI